MAEYLRISATFLDGRFHGRGDHGEPEWPPSPLRLMQAIVAANAEQIDTNSPLGCALKWLEQQGPPVVLAPRGERGASYRLSVPNNAMDLVGKAWARGVYFGTGDSNPATHRTMKTVRPVHLIDGETVHYVWPLAEGGADEQADAVIEAARRMIALGWGIDMVAGDAERIDGTALASLPGQRWSATPSYAPVTLRVPVRGTLEALRERYSAFVQRMGEDGFVPVEPLTTFDTIGYRRPIDTIGRPWVVFELREEDGSFHRYAQRKLIHIAGMVRHLAREAMTASPPRGTDEGWTEKYVVGHRTNGEVNHRQLSYVPLPSIGHAHADQFVRRIMITAPLGDEHWLEHLARYLAGRQLVPERGNEFGESAPPTLVRVQRDNVARRYTRSSDRWATVTPVILPGHDDRKPAKTRKLIEAALAQSGIEQPCEYEWSRDSCFRKSYSTGRGSSGYFRPDHLRTQTAVHLRIRFKDDLQMNGPIAIGAGRHCGLGLLAPENES